ncbi:MAG: type I restriction endonuclease subunit R [Symploca sp. SIO1B1]|nr:type I restriction endonuclease subunit R [Symploca sp. SIO2D2]NER23711.1 type I restriction endonuclease subunit R [Symploca sp. SIO1C2]NER47864.1 type I restriction endonuclease subunit R [Symploca sp. SIO1A3]NER96329.1 type I restriction endonuclease subunit R [Symploca sp. SIO1B1]
MTTPAISEVITTLAEAEWLFDLIRTEDERFFPEWRTGLPNLFDIEKIALNELRRRYLYQRGDGYLSEGTVMLILISPLLATAGFFDPPFKVRAQESAQITLDDGEETLQGRIDVLVLRHQLWIIVIESEKTPLSVWSALPQTLAYLMANPQPEQPSFGMMTNGDDILFVKLTQTDPRQYDVSRVFAPLISKQELYSALQVLKGISRLIKA